jgi:hypothetical protein
MVADTEEKVLLATTLVVNMNHSMSANGGLRRPHHNNVHTSSAETRKA